ncbi:MAG: molybdopterin molybdotransferase MoeA [Xanthomonadales bacterium]|nr:molybdopterin molybdotransferase MoeA [Xanthomonadales bacterium]
MLEVNAAIDRLLKSSERLVEAEECPLIEAAGRVLADSLTAPIDVPPADNSAMDGYAFRYEDWPGPEAELSLSQRITAGSVPQSLAPSSAARIFTGAEIPAGADTVVMQERCEEFGAGVRILERPVQGANIRPRGQDITAGQQILVAGHRLRTQDLGLAASLGIHRIPVFRRLRVAAMSTGDELREPGEAAGPGQIYNSNRFIMCPQLKAWGFEVIDLGVARDNPAAVREMLLEGAERADVIVSSGGVSVGEEDHVKEVVKSLGSIDLWRIAIKPGKPFAFGQVRGTPLIGLPGNPVSVFVTLLVVARPYLFACQGNADHALNATRQVALFDKPGSSREDYLRVRSTPDGLEQFPNQSSGVLFSTCWGDGLVRQSVGEDIEAGGLADFLPYALFN